MTKVSVVIASVNGRPSIDECLTALSKQQGQFEAEILVVDCCQDGTAEYISANFPEVKLLHISERLGIPALRAMGMSQATGDIIVIIEDHVIVDGNWFEEIIKAHQSGYKVVGGAVENGSVDRIVDWAVFLCEYSHTMLPIPHGEAEEITGNNVSYRREVLDQVDESIKRDYWEYFLHEELKKSGVKFFSAPSIVVHHKKEFGFIYFMSQRFHYSRSFAAMRRSRVSILGRLFYVAFSPLLPFLMTWRIVRQVLQKKRLYKELLFSLPLLTIFMTSYACGEFMGYMFGPGESLIEVE